MGSQTLCWRTCFLVDELRKCISRIRATTAYFIVKVELLSFWKGLGRLRLCRRLVTHQRSRPITHPAAYEEMIVVNQQRRDVEEPTLLQVWTDLVSHNPGNRLQACVAQNKMLLLLSPLHWRKSRSCSQPYSAMIKSAGPVC